MTNKQLQLTAIKIFIGLINKGIKNKIYNEEEIILFNGCILVFVNSSKKLTTVNEEQESRSHSSQEKEEEKEEVKDDYERGSITSIIN